MAYRRGTGRFAKNGDIIGISTERMYIGFDPFQTKALIVQCRIQGVIGSQSRRHRETLDADAEAVAKLADVACRCEYVLTLQLRR